jgi:hypothetical protein
MLRSGRWLLAAASLSVFSALSSPSRGQVPTPPARTEAELASARQLFAEALRDERDRRFDVALDGFRRVRDVRDTAPVEYRIATCLEGLSRLAEALSAYEAAIRLTEGDASGADVAAGSQERVDALSRRVAHLRVALSMHAPADAAIRVDGKTQRSGDIVLDPGSHRVEATATGAAPFQSDIALPEGGGLSLTVPLDPVTAPATTLPVPDLRREGASSAPTASTTTWGWIGIAAGGVLTAASVVSFVLRENDIRTANRDCPGPGGGCVGSIDGEALSATNRARVEGPLGYALGGAGLLAVGLGAYLVVSSPARTSALTVVPRVSADGAGLELRGAL